MNKKEICRVLLSLFLIIPITVGISDYYKARKRESKAFLLPFFARKAGINSVGFTKMWSRGARASEEH